MQIVGDLCTVKNFKCSLCRTIVTFLRSSDGVFELVIAICLMPFEELKQWQLFHQVLTSTDHTFHEIEKICRTWAAVTASIWASEFTQIVKPVKFDSLIHDPQSPPHHLHMRTSLNEGWRIWHNANNSSIKFDIVWISAPAIIDITLIKALLEDAKQLPKLVV